MRAPAMTVMAAALTFDEKHGRVPDLSRGVLGLAGIPAGVVSREPGNAEQTGVRVKRGDDHGTATAAAATRHLAG